MREGYKQSEIGNIPVDWEAKKIVDFANIITGDKNTQDRVADGKYPFIVRSDKVERINSWSFDGEAILTAGDGVGTGKIFHLMNGKFDYHQRVYNIHGFSDDVHGKYFYWQFSRNFYERIMSMTAKSSVDSVRREMIADMFVALPPIVEQKAIAEALSDVDALIESLEKLIAKKRATKTATMQKLLDPKVNGWKETSLAHVCNFENGDRGVNYPSKKDFKSIGVPFVNAGNLESNIISTRKLDYITEQKFSELGGGKYRVGDFLFCLRGSLGKFALISDKVKLGAIASSLIIIRPKDRALHVGFFKAYLQSNLCASMIEKWSGGAAQPNLGGKDLGRFSIFLPDNFEEQIRVGELFEAIDLELSLLNTRLKKTRETKQGMMQELLSGRTRLV